ncbi:MAG: SCO family protein [Endozoicomonadaceae bacterium]|nr:SCO family protein [Endozoicomonadaceae bacterium]
MVKKSKRFLILCLVAFVFLGIGLAINKFTNTRSANLLTIDKSAMQQQGLVLFDMPRRFKIPVMQTTKAAYLTSEQLKNKWTFLYFGFTQCPDVCPATLSKLKELNRAIHVFDPVLAKRTQYLIVSVDPGRDTIDFLTDYLSIFDTSFIGVLGNAGDTSHFSKQFNVMYSKVKDGTENTEDYQIDHSAQIIIINPNGDYQGYIRPGFEVEKLLPSLKTMNRVLGVAVEEKQTSNLSEK